MNNSEETNKLGKSMLLVSVASFVTLLFSFLRETVLAYYFGADPITDAYNIAIQLPVILFSTLSTAISKVVIPSYASKDANEGIKAAHIYTSNFISAYTLISFMLVLGCVFFAKTIIYFSAPGLSDSQSQLATTAFRIVVPIVIITGIIKVNNGVLNYHHRFLAPVLTVNCMSITFIICVIFFTRSLGIYSAILGTLSGTVLEFIVSCGIRRKNMKYSPILKLRDPELLKSVKLAIPLFIGIGVEEIGKICDKMISSFLDAGGISSLNYAGKLSSAVSSLLLMGVTTVSYPEFTRSAAKDNEKKMAEVFVYSFSMFLLILIPVICGGVWLNKEITMIVFARGKFDMNAVFSTAPLFACYLVALLFSSIRQLCSNVFFAYGDTKTPMINSSIGIVINVVLSLILSRTWGAIGIALATSISTIIVTVILCYDTKKKNPSIAYKKTLKESTKMIISSMVMIVILLLIRMVFDMIGLYDESSTFKNLIYVLSCVLIGSGVYILTIYLMKCEIAISMIRNLKNKRKE